MYKKKYKIHLNCRKRMQEEKLKTEELKMQKDRKYGQIWAAAPNFISKEEKYKSALCSDEMIYL